MSPPGEFDPSRVPAFLRDQVERLDGSWREALADALEAPGLAALGTFLAKRCEEQVRIYPASKDYLRALELTPLNNVRVVILGQDPYHQPGRAHGLSFSFATPGPPQDSLRNVFIELGRDLGVPFPSYSNLDSWARQGVLLLNTILTVEEGKPREHANLGWEPLTDAIIAAVAKRREHVVFMLWGKPAQGKVVVIREADSAGRHCILMTSHPAGQGAYRGFRGCGQFGQANECLRMHRCSAIDWALPEDDLKDLQLS